MDNNELLAELELTKESWNFINEAKKKYHDVYYVQIYDNYFIYRLPSLLEFQELERQIPDVFELQEEVCRRYVLDPVIEDWSEDIPAGYVETLAKEIINYTGAWWDKETVANKLEEANQDISSLATLLPLTIKKAFPEYTFDEIRGWSFPRQLEFYQYAKWMINLDNDGFEISATE